MISLDVGALYDLVRRAVRDELEARGVASTSTVEKRYTPEEAAEIAGVKPRTMRSWIEAAKIASTKVGGRRFILERDLRAFLERDGRGDNPTKAIALRGIERDQQAAQKLNGSGGSNRGSEYPTTPTEGT